MRCNPLRLLGGSRQGSGPRPALSRHGSARFAADAAGWQKRKDPEINPRRSSPDPIVSKIKSGLLHHQRFEDDEAGVDVQCWVLLEVRADVVEIIEAHWARVLLVCGTGAIAKIEGQKLIVKLIKELHKLESYCSSP